MDFGLQATTGGLLFRTTLVEVERDGLEFAQSLQVATLGNQIASHIHAQLSNRGVRLKAERL